MKVWTTWHGGPNYSAPYVADDTEEFPSLAAAKNELWRRERGHDPYYPSVEDSEMWVYFGDPRESRDPYPDRILRVGPRGGVQSERT